MEKEVVRNATNHDAQKQLSYTLVLEKWRAKVFEYLVATKRYELVIRDNLAAYNDEKSSLKSTIADLQTQLQLSNTKLNTATADNQYKQQTIARIDALNASQRKESEHLKEENAMMKQALKSLKTQANELLKSQLATCKQHVDAKLAAQGSRLAKCADMLEVVVQSAHKRIQVRSQNRELKQRVAAFESELVQHKELKERFEEQARQLASRMETNEELSLKIINLERDLEEARELKKSEIQRVKHELKVAQDYAEALASEKTAVTAKLSEAEEQAYASKLEYDRILDVKERTF